MGALGQKYSEEGTTRRSHSLTKFAGDYCDE